MIRAGKGAFLIDEFINRNIVALGWDLGDLSDKSEENIKELMKEKYPSDNAKTIGINASQVSRFRHKVKIGDYVLTSNPSAQNYLFGRIVSDYYYITELEDETYDGFENIRDVKWLGEIPYDKLQKSTKSTLGTQTTLFNITKKAKIDIYNVFRKINEVEYDKSAKIIRDYLDENDLGKLEREEYESAIKSFYDKFSPEILEKLEGLELLNKIFIHDGDQNNLCYNLEFSKEYGRFGGIGGGSAFKYYLFKSKDLGWRVGPTQKPTNISEEDAIQIGTKIRDAIVSGAKFIKSAKLDTVDDYKKVDSTLNEIFQGTHVHHTSSWIHKYYVMIFPDKFAKWHNEGGKEQCIAKFNILPEDWYYAKDGQLHLLAEKAGIKLYSLIDGTIEGLFEDNETERKTVKKEEGNDGEEGTQNQFASNLKRNVIYFGAPGTGKSYNLNVDKDDLISDEDSYERVTFHPDYSYANFVGTYKPVPKSDSISYEYVPGPFMRSLVKALKNPEKPFLLIIEEINRSNVAAVFGDVFQLLDRDKSNESRYSIETTEDMRNYLKEELNEEFEKIKIPSNMFIWATMNSADQGVFPMDTAFKRRWDFKYFGINFNEELIEHIKVNLNGQEISWNDLRKAINNELLSYRINEDKLLGPFFAFNEYLDEELTDEEFKEIFKNKIIMYLFEDAAKAKRNDLFAGARENNNVIYSRVCELFDEIGIEIFCDNIKEELLDYDEEELIGSDLEEEEII